jgi:4'-phosphopantetheinyl transferase
MIEPLWSVPSANLTLSSDEVHVWRAALDLAQSQVDYLREILSEDEAQRADRFAFERDRKRFTVARGLLRLVLSRYLNIDARQLRFYYSAYGKPALILPDNTDSLFFNVSHAHGLALYALARGSELGVDIEYVRPIQEVERIAQQFFSAQEQSALRALPEDQRLRAFFECWTRKEAYIKARGEGLSLPLDQFDVSLAPGAPAKLLAVASDEREHTRWMLQSLDPGPGYVAALAIEGQGWISRCWRWPSSDKDDQLFEGNRG